MGLKQQPKCKERTCRFQSNKYCTILKERPTACRFYKERIDLTELVKEKTEESENESL